MNHTNQTRFMNKNSKNIIARECNIKKLTLTFHFFLGEKVIFLFRFSKNNFALFEIGFEHAFCRLVRKSIREMCYHLRDRLGRA